VGNDWYYVKNGKQLGPFSWFQLGQLAKSDVLQPLDLIAQAGTSRWIAASTVPGLFGSSVQPATEIRSAAPTPTAPPAVARLAENSGRFVASPLGQAFSQ
jgi:hypothetical protein